MAIARKLCLQLWTQRRQSALYAMRPRSFRKNSHSSFFDLLMRGISADMRFKKIASTSGVRTHRKNERFSFAADTPILFLGESPKPLISELEILSELCGKPIDFIR